MARLCERPGCSSPAAVVYGMEYQRSLVWLEVVPEGTSLARTNVVCRRHADAMVVPRGWTLDDRRDDRPRLFKLADPPSIAVPTSVRTARGATTPASAPAQLDLTVGEIRPLGDTDPDETQALPWHPDFDADDDLDGLLTARSPLLSRAFSGRQRPTP